MSPGSFVNTSGRQGSAPIPPNRSQRPPERSRGEGRSKRTLIESACTACQKRKSRCDGQRPSCSRCQALHTECGYNAEEGESRWSALRRKSRTLERERDEARELLVQMQSRPEPEAQEIYHRLRTHTPTSDLSTLIHDVTSASPVSSSQPDRQLLQQQHQEQQQQREQLHYDQQQEQHQLQQLHQQQQRQQLHQHQQPQQPQQQTQGPFFLAGYTTAAPANQLPPLRSIVEVPTPGNNTVQQPLPQHFPPTSQRQLRKMSQASGMSSGSYSSLSSSDGHDRPSVSPQGGSPRDWAQAPNHQT